jgi:hypothetical protein
MTTFRDSGNFKTLKTQVKLILNFTRPHTITYTKLAVKVSADWLAELAVLPKPWAIVLEALLESSITAIS